MLVDRPHVRDVAARTRRHDDRAQPRDLGRPTPVDERLRRIRAHDKAELGIGVLASELAQGVDRVGHARALDLAQVELEARVVRDGELDHARALQSRRHVLVELEVRVSRRDEQHPREAERVGHGARHLEVRVVDGVEGPAHDAESVGHASRAPAPRR